MMYLGDYAEDETVYFVWSSNGADGASITRATDGTVSVYKDNGTTQSTAGITDTEDFDSLTGIHACTIDTSADAFYATGADYAVVLSAATIDGETVNAVLAHFSIENRYAAGPVELSAAAVDAIWDEALSGHTTSGTAGDQLNSTAAIVATASVDVVEAVSGDTITVYKGDTWSFDIEGLPATLSDYEVLAFVVKTAAGDADNDAMLYVRDDDDLVRIGAAAPVASTGGTISFATTTLTVYVAMTETVAAGLTAGTHHWAIVGFDTTADPDTKTTLVVGSWVINEGWLDSVTP